MIKGKKKTADIENKNRRMQNNLINNICDRIINNYCSFAHDVDSILIKRLFNRAKFNRKDLSFINNVIISINYFLIAY